MNQGPRLGQPHDASCRSRADPCSWKGPSKSSRRTAPLLARTGLSSHCAPAVGALSSLGATRATAAGRSGRPHRRLQSGAWSEDSPSRRVSGEGPTPSDTGLWACPAVGKGAAGEVAGAWLRRGGECGVRLRAQSAGFASLTCCLRCLRLRSAESDEPDEGTVMGHGGNVIVELTADHREL